MSTTAYFPFDCGFSLAQIHPPNQWLLAMRNDMYAQETHPVTADDSSVIFTKRRPDS